MGPPKAIFAGLNIAYLREVNDRARDRFEEYARNIATTKTFGTWLGEEHARLLKPRARSESVLMVRGEDRGRLLAAVRVIWLRELGHEPESSDTELDALAKSLRLDVTGKTLRASLKKTEELWERTASGESDAPVETEEEADAANRITDVLLRELLGHWEGQGAWSPEPYPSQGFDQAEPSEQPDEPTARRVPSIFASGSDLLNDRHLGEVIGGYIREEERVAVRRYLTNLRATCRRSTSNLPHVRQVLEALLDGGRPTALYLGLAEAARRIRAFGAAHPDAFTRHRAGTPEIQARPTDQVAEVARALAADPDVGVCLQAVAGFAAWCSVELRWLERGHHAEQATSRTPLVSLWRVVGPVMAAVEMLQVAAQTVVMTNSEPLLVTALRGFTNLLQAAKRLIPYYESLGYEHRKDVASWEEQWPWRPDGPGAADSPQATRDTEPLAQ